MGANGSFASGSTNSELGRAYHTIANCGEVQIVTPKNPKAGIKLPEESHTPNRTYATFYKDGHDVKAIAKYGADGTTSEIANNLNNRLFAIFSFNPNRASYL